MANSHPKMSTTRIDPVNAVPSFPKLTILGFQHVLAFYAGAVVVPLVIATGLGLDSATTVHLINADLFTCGIASIIQSAGLGPKIGVRLPLLQGVTFTAVSPLIAVGLAAGGGVEGLDYRCRHCNLPCRSLLCEASSFLPAGCYRHVANGYGNDPYFGCRKRHRVLGN